MAFAEGENEAAAAEAEAEAAKAEAEGEKAAAEAEAEADKAEAEAEANAAKAEAEAEAEAAKAEAEAKAAEAKAKLPDQKMFLLGNDLMWFGRDTKLTEYKAANDFIGAGETVTVMDSTIGGSIRLGGRVIKVSGTKVGQSITVAGQDISIKGGSSKAVALAGASTEFVNASTGDLNMATNKAYINGTVTGNVVVFADTLEIGPNAVIKGTLSGEVSKEPTIDANAAIGANKIVVKAHTQDTDEPTKLFNIPVIALSTLSALAIALIAEWWAGGHTAGAAELLKERPGSYLGSSLLGTLLLPFVIILFCIPVVTIPVSIALLLMSAAISLVAEGFVGAMLGRLIAQRANRYVMAAIFGAIVGALAGMPYVGIPMRVIVYALMLGYIVCSMRKAMAERKEQAYA